MQTEVQYVTHYSVLYSFDCVTYTYAQHKHDNPSGTVVIPRYSTRQASWFLNSVDCETYSYAPNEHADPHVSVATLRYIE